MSVGIRPLVKAMYTLNTKQLKATIASATLRLDALRRDPLGQDTQVYHELGCLYNLFLQLSESVQALQEAHNDQV